MRKKPLITAAAVTYLGGVAVSVVTLHVDPRDIGDMAAALDVAEGLDLADHIELGKQLAANDEPQQPPQAASSPSSDAPSA